MRSVLLIVTIASVLLMFACGTNPKTDITKSKALEELVLEKSFEIVSDWAMPLTTASLVSIANSGLLQPGNTPNRINLIGNPNFLKFEGDSVSAYLPYFGERQMGGGYNNNGGAIQFKGIPNDLEISTDEKKQTKRIGFTINDTNSTESFNVTLTLYPNLTSLININSSQRLNIQYSGSVSEVLNRPGY